MRTTKIFALGAGLGAVGGSVVTSVVRRTMNRGGHTAHDERRRENRGDGSTPNRTYHHVALYSVRSDIADAGERGRLARELRDKLISLHDLPEPTQQLAWVADRTGTADVILWASYDAAGDFDRARAEPRHRAVVDWYLEHFDDAERRQIEFWTTGGAVV